MLIVQYGNLWVKEYNYYLSKYLFIGLIIAKYNSRYFVCYTAIYYVYCYFLLLAIGFYNNLILFSYLHAHNII
jgi:hypothetical protein